MEERYTQIEKENRMLLEKIMHIMHAKAYKDLMSPN